MSKVTLRQFSFNRGELDPALHGRSDWKYYYHGAEKLANLITRSHGGAVKRGGLRMVARALSDATPSHFIPFRFSVQQSYMLEFGHYKMRIIKDGGIVVYPAGHAKAGQEVVVETPYPVDVLPRLRYAQTADVMILAHADYPPRRLSRHDHHDWRLERLVTNQRTATPENLRITSSGGDNSRYLVTAVSATGGESPPSESVTAVNANLLSAPASGTFSELYTWLREHDYSYVPANLRFHDMNADAMIAFLESCGYQTNSRRISGDTYRWHHVKPNATSESIIYWTATNLSELLNECFTAGNKGLAGTAKSALATAIDNYVADYNAGLSGNKITALAWNAVSGANGYRLYRSRTQGGQSSFFLIATLTATSYTDQNVAAQATGLPADNDLFSGVDDYPGVCAFFEQRLILGRTNNKPTAFWGSDTGCYNAFTRHSPVLETDSYEFTLASGEMNEIRWIVPLNDMLLGSSGGEWKAGGGGGAITPLNINARVQSWYGCSPLAPVVTGRTIIFAGRGRQTIRSFSYSLEADGYTGRDLTSYAAHLFRGRQILGMCYQQEPSGIIWTVLSDGTLLSCTFQPEEDVVAWSRHETRGKFESCGSMVDMDGSDQVYFCVERKIAGATRRFIETLECASDLVDDAAEGFFLDCGLSYRGAPVGMVGGLGHLEGEEIACLADGNLFTGLKVKNGAVTFPDGFTASIVHAGLPYTAELLTLELEPDDSDTIRNRARFAVSAAVRFLASRDCQYSHSDGALAEMKFRTNETPGQPIRLFTGEKSVVFSTPPGARTTRLRFVSDTPTPFTLLTIVAEASCGQPA